MNNKIIEEDWVIGLILYGGNARSLAMQAIDQAASGAFELAKERMKEAHVALNQAHEYQSNLLKDGLDTKDTPQSILLTMHGQDHLMGALTVIDLAERFIQLYQRLDEGEKK